MTIWDDTRNLIADGEPNVALDLVESFLRGRLGNEQRTQARSHLDTLIMLRAKNRQLATNMMRGLLTTADAGVQQARQDHAVLSLITEVERMDRSRSPSVTIELPEQIPTEKLMGAESQLRSTGWLGEGLRLASAVCRLTDGSVFGSGFRCRHDAILTNHHVIASAEIASGFRAEFFFEEDGSRRLRAPISIRLEPRRLFWASARYDIGSLGLRVSHATMLPPSRLCRT